VPLRSPGSALVGLSSLLVFLYHPKDNSLALAILVGLLVYLQAYVLSGIAPAN
jgi:hypothetical protein